MTVTLVWLAGRGAGRGIFALTFAAALVAAAPARAQQPVAWWSFDDQLKGAPSGIGPAA